ncbi:uncharacterized protein LOC5518732 isoform X1 [Nematostella vectensis]|uniref:uncharacterized protein LOC5518732 isoform X1 n=2 Tax=Nematostella vectensis TaxID=45351 RepID=UPI002077320B|nr:uncharacterized protein LOC5518732 isoform X1 [Nematostella vectensis]
MLSYCSHNVDRMTSSARAQKISTTTTSPDNNAVSHDTPGSNDQSEDLQKQLTASQVILNQREAMAKELQKERNSQIALNDVLCLEIDELRRALCIERTRSRAHSRHLQQMCHQANNNLASTIPGLENDKSVVFYIISNMFRLPRTWLVGATSRITLFSWWVGKWFNEGLSILKVENKWLELQKANARLEEEKTSMEEHAHYLQQLLQEKEDHIAHAQEMNKILKQRVEKLAQKQNPKKNKDTKELEKRLDILLENIQRLNSSIENMERRMSGATVDLESIYKRIRSMANSQKRLESHEKVLEEHLKEMLEVIAHMQMREEKRYFRDMSREAATTGCVKCSSVRRGSSLPNMSLPYHDALKRQTKHDVATLESVRITEEDPRKDVTPPSSVTSSSTSDVSHDDGSGEDSHSFLDDTHTSIELSDAGIQVELQASEVSHSKLDDSFQLLLCDMSGSCRIIIVLAMFGSLFLFIYIALLAEEYFTQPSRNYLYNKNSSFFVTVVSIFANLGRYLFVS